MSSRFGPWPVLALLLSLVLRTGPALADRDEAGAQICERAIAARARARRRPRGRAARDLADRDRAGAERAAPALALGDQSRGQGLLVREPRRGARLRQGERRSGRTSFDVGCFQINYFWHGRNFPSLESMFDPRPAPTMRRGSCAASTPSAATGRRRPAPTTRSCPTAPASIAPASTASSRASAARRSGGGGRAGRRRRRSRTRRARAGRGCPAARRSSPFRPAARPRSRRRRGPRPRSMRGVPARVAVAELNL